MSIKVISWVREYAPTENPAELCILYSLADRANDDGQGCWPSVATLAQESRCSERTVQRHLRNLEERGLIRRGDQRLVDRYRADRRPVVWDLNLGLKRDETGRQNDTPHGERGDNPGINGVTNQAPRGDTVVTQTVSKPSIDVSKPSIDPEGERLPVTTGSADTQDSPPPPQSLDELAQQNAAASQGVCAKHPQGNPTDVPCRGCAQAREWQEKQTARRAEASKGEEVRKLRQRNAKYRPPEPMPVAKYPPGVAECACPGCGASAGQQCVKYGKVSFSPCGERLRVARNSSHNH